MIFGKTEKYIILTHTNILAIAKNISVQDRICDAGSHMWKKQQQQH